MTKGPSPRATGLFCTAVAALSLDHFGPQVVFVGIHNAHADFVTWLHGGAVDKYAAVDFRCVCMGAANGALIVHFVD